MNKCTINDVAKTIGSGITPSRSNNAFWSNPKYPWLKTEQLGTFQIFDTDELVLCQEKVQIKMSKLFLNISMYHKLVQIIAAFAFILFYPTSFAAFCKYCVSYWLGDL